MNKKIAIATLNNINNVIWILIKKINNLAT